LGADAEGPQGIHTCPYRGIEALGAAEAVLRRTNAHGANKALSGLLAGWWREAQATGRKPSTYESYRNTVAGLTKFLNHDDASRVTPEDVAPMHGWRHRWKSLAIDAGIPQRVQDAILGHAARDVAGTYGDVSVVVMAREVGRLPRVC
jgi:hypothetical protein